MREKGELRGKREREKDREGEIYLKGCKRGKKKRVIKRE